MSTVNETSSRLSAAEKVRAVVWLATRPKPIEAETMTAAAKHISEELNIKLTAAVLQDILDADASLASKVAIGSSGALAHVTAVVEELSLRVEAIGRLLDDFDMRLKSAVAHQEQFDHQVGGSLNTLGTQHKALVEQVTAVVDMQTIMSREVGSLMFLGRSLYAWAEVEASGGDVVDSAMAGLQAAIMKRPPATTSGANGEKEKIPPVKELPQNGPGSVISS